MVRRSVGQGTAPSDVPRARGTWVLFSAEPLFAAGQLFTSPTLLVWLTRFGCIPFVEVIELLSMFSMPGVVGRGSCWEHG